MLRVRIVQQVSLRCAELASQQVSWFFRLSQSLHLFVVEGTQAGHCSFVQEGFEGRDEGVGEDVGAFGCGMDAVLLDGVGDVDQVLVDHGDEGGVVLGGEVAEDLVEGIDVVLAVVGREGDAGEQYLYMGGFKSGEHLVEIVAGLVGGQAAETVVAAEFDDYDLRMQEQDGAEAGDGVLGGCAAGTLVVDLVMVAKGVEFLLQVIGIGLAGLEAVAGGDAVAEADEEGVIGGLGGSSEERGGEKDAD